MSQASAVQRLIALRAGRTSARKPSELLVSVSRYFSLVNRHKASPTPESADLIEGIRQQLTREIKVLEAEQAFQGGQLTPQAA